MNPRKETKLQTLLRASYVEAGGDEKNLEPPKKFPSAESRQQEFRRKEEIAKKRAEQCAKMREAKKAKAEAKLAAEIAARADVEQAKKIKAEHQHNNAVANANSALKRDVVSQARLEMNAKRKSKAAVDYTAINNAYISGDSTLVSSTIPNWLYRMATERDVDLPSLLRAAAAIMCGVDLNKVECKKSQYRIA